MKKLIVHIEYEDNLFDSPQHFESILDAILEAFASAGGDLDWRYFLVFDGNGVTPSSHALALSMSSED